MIRKAARIFITLAFAAVTLPLSAYLGDIFLIGMTYEAKLGLIGASTVFMGALGYLLAPYIISVFIKFTQLFEASLQKLPTQDIVAGVIGVIFGLIIANLLGASFSRFPFIGPYIPMAGSVILGYLGWSIGTKKKDDILAIANMFRFGKDKEKISKTSPDESYKILDTSVIIDGRIADICRSGFIDGTLLIPGFVLEELRHIADSSDLLKRNRGRRGLDVLNKIRKEIDIKVQIYDQDFEDIAEVDSKLVKLAKNVNGKVVTNDFNLNKVAELQGVEVLNINELANAVKPVVLPGENMSVQIIKDGKESGQGIGYLDDGTMIVVENGRKYIGQTTPVLVTSVLQTSAGRMIFAKPDLSDKKQASGNDKDAAVGEVSTGASHS